MGRYYSYDTEDGFGEHATAEAAERAAELALEEYRDQSSDGWPEDVESIQWGRLLPLGEIVETRGTLEQDDCARARGCDYWCDYHLASQPDELAQLRAERDTLRARVAELESQEAMRLEALRELARLRVEEPALRARVAELESPPVVPEGWEVSSRHGAWGLLDRHGYAVDADDTGIMHTSIDDCIPWSALRALAWAIEHDERPPHAGDE